ncbi:hypothetical protein [Helicobacter saguini]|nr:hypothetical protein [Helicobacter saguini]
MALDSIFCLCLESLNLRFYILALFRISSFLDSIFLESFRIYII